MKVKEVLDISKCDVIITATAAGGKEKEYKYSPRFESYIPVSVLNSTVYAINYNVPGIYLFVHYADIFRNDLFDNIVQLNNLSKACDINGMPDAAEKVHEVFEMLEQLND